MGFLKIAVIIPCYNEELTIAKVVNDFKKELPEAEIYVIDNNSTDNSNKLAKQAGAIVIKEPRQGKGNVIRSSFREIEADIYVMVDGDDTYPAYQVKELIEPIKQKEADMVVGNRHANNRYKQENKRAFHTFGNNLVKKLINSLFSTKLEDIMSGYRAFNNLFVKNFPINSSGFEIETEMTLHALDKRFLIKEIPIEYKDRPAGSYSKLNTFKDGFRVLKTILWVFKDYKPLIFFSLVSFLFLILGLLVGMPVIVEFMETRYISKIPSAILATGFMLISVVSLFSGFILDTIVKQHKENYELWLNRAIADTKTK